MLYRRQRIEILMYVAISPIDLMPPSVFWEEDDGDPRIEVGPLACLLDGIQEIAKSLPSFQG